MHLFDNFKYTDISEYKGSYFFFMVWQNSGKYTWTGRLWTK